MLVLEVLLCLGLSMTIGPDQDKPEVPKGYEDAAPAEQRQPAARPAPAAGNQRAEEVLNRSVLDVLTDAVEKGPDPKVRNLQPEDLSNVRQLLKPELAFVRRVCEPDKEQLREVAAAVRGSFGIPAAEEAVMQNQIQGRVVMGGMMVGMAGAMQGGSMDTARLRAIVQKQMTTVVKARLRPDQARQYEEECAKRTARRKRAVVLNLVAKLDEELALSADQREKLVESLTAGYKESWDQWLMTLTFIDQFSPDIPQDRVLPVLSEKQKTIWRQTPKMDVNAIGGFHFAPMMVEIEEEL